MERFFKIDVLEYSSEFPIGLFTTTCRKNWRGKRKYSGWELIGVNRTKDEARALYERVKGLPEFLT